MRIPHEFTFRPGLRHIDGQGILYHAEYLGFADQARTEFLRHYGYPPARWIQEGITFVVRKCAIRYLQRVYFDDEITIKTQIAKLHAMHLDMDQTFWRHNLSAATLQVQIVCVSLEGRLQPLPESLAKTLPVNDKFTQPPVI